MAVFRFSALSDGQSINFTPTADVLNFDQTQIAAADIRVTVVGSNIQVSHLFTGKDVTLLNVSPLQLSITNITFADGSRLLFGDTTSSALNDNAANTINGTAGRDLLAGFGGADTMNGGLGNDTYIVGTGDVLSDTGGIDTVESDINWQLADGIENLKATGTANISLTGNNAANELVGNSGNNFFNPRGGDDSIFGFAGNDWVRLGGGGVPTYGNKLIHGGLGFDTLDFGGFARSAIVVDLGLRSMTGGGEGGAGSASVEDIEAVIGDGFNDRISGSFAAESLNGGGGNDTLDGRGGNDTLTGGLGADTFGFSTAPGTGNVEGITDFVSATDKLSFDNNVFTALGASGSFTAGDGRFVAGAGFTSGRDASDRLIYNTTTGQLFYDADGNGAGASQLVATLQGAPALAATDIVVTGRAGIVGTPGNDSLVGTPGNDSISGLEGNDTIDALGGDDTLDGGTGTDLLLGGDGNDTLIDTALVPAGAAPDTLDGGLGNDTYDLRTDNFFPFPPTVLRDAGGVDTVLAEGFTLPEGFENLILFPHDTDSSVTGIGNSSNNNITSNSGGNRIDGADGDDTLIGASGSDIFSFVAGSGNYGHDSVDGGSGNFEGGFIDVLTFDGARSAVVVDMRTGIATGGGVAGSGSVAFSNIESVVGSGFDDRLTAHNGVTDEGQFFGAFLNGGAGNDTLIGGAASDNLTGGAGQDNFVFAAPPGAGNVDVVLDFGSGSDKLVFDNGAFTALGGAGNFAPGDARFASGAGLTSGQDSSDRLVYNTTTGELFYDADGSGAGASQLVATLQGAPALAATDIAVTGQTGGPTIIQGTAGNDSLTGTAGDDSISGLAGNDTIDGLDGADTLRGGDGDDTLIDNADSGPVKVLDGGLGNDTYRLGASPFDQQTAAVSIVDAGGIDTVFSAEGLTLPDGIENLTLAGVGVRAAGNGLDNVITVVRQEGFGGCLIDAGAGNDTLIGGAETDTMTGGSGNDVFVFARPDTDGGLTQIQDFASGIDRLQFDNAGYTQIGGAGSFAQGDPRFVSGAGLTSAQDANDRLIYNTTDGRLFYDADGNGAGQQVLVARLTGAPNLAATDIVVTGQPQSGPIVGTAGNDSLTGTAGDDLLQGLAGNDTLNGLAGNDTLDAGTGGDLLIGGTGNDTYFVDGPGDTVVENAGEGIDAIFSSATRTLDPNVENLTLTGTAAIDGIGNALDNAIIGNSATNSLTGGDGNDTLDGGTGVDNLNGGLGNDTYIVTAGDVVSDAGGVDTVLSDITWALADGFENLILTGTGNINATGNNAANLLTGNSGNNFFNPRGGDDTIHGGAGNDQVTLGGGGVPTYGNKFIDLGAGFDRLDFSGFAKSAIVVDLAAGTLRGGGDAGQGSATLSGIETVVGDAFNDRLSGSGVAEALNGGGGNDTIDGRGGNDTLTGGLGADTFVFDTAPASGNVDQVTDFVSASDRLNFDNATFAALGADGNFAAGDARFAAGAGFTAGRDASDRLVYDITTGNLYYDADGSGAGAAQLVATIQGHPAVAATDITVI